jgi:endonuclease YncB( thermonuclease family)
LVFGKQIRVEQQDRDRYGRVVARVYAGGLDINAEQVKRGMAVSPFLFFARMGDAALSPLPRFHMNTLHIQDESVT